MDKFDKNKAIAKLTEKKAMLPCHRCGHTRFGILDGVSSLPLIDDLNMLGKIIVGGVTAPILHVVCENCGAITSHSLGVLGLMPKGETNE